MRATVTGQCRTVPAATFCMLLPRSPQPCSLDPVELRKRPMACLEANEVQCVGFSGWGDTYHILHPPAQAGPAGHTALPAMFLPVLTSVSHRQCVSTRDTACSPSYTERLCLWFLNSAWKWIAFLWQELHQGGEVGRPHYRTKIHEV